MNLQELTGLLVTSSQQVNRCKFIPRWEDSFEDSTYRYDILKPEVVQESEACLATCSRDMLLAPVGSYGRNAYHFLAGARIPELATSYSCTTKSMAQRASIARLLDIDVNLADNRGNTALHYSLLYGSADVARFLIRKGADHNRPGNRGRTPVQIAVEKGHDTILELMTDIR